MTGEPGPSGEALSDKQTTRLEIREIRNRIAKLEQELDDARATLEKLTERDGSIGHTSDEVSDEGGRWRQGGLEYGVKLAARLREPGQLTSETAPYNHKPNMQLGFSAGSASSEKTPGSLAMDFDKRQRWLFDNLSEGIIHMELIRTGAGQRDDFRILSVNPAFETVSGFKEEQVIGQVLSVLEPSIEDSMIDRFAVVSRTGQPDQWEEPVLLFEKTFWIVAISLQTGRCMLLLSDISTGRQKEEVLHLSEKRMRTILDNLPVGVWLVDENGKIVYGNQAGIKIWGGAKYVGIDELHQYRAWWADTGRPILPHEWAGSRAIQKGESSIDEVIEIECFDGSRKIIKNSAVPVFGEKKEILGAVVVNQDISQSRLAEQKLKTSEARLRRLVDSNIIGVMFLDENGHIWDANDAYLDIIGYSREELVAGELRWNRLAPVEYHKRAAQAVAEAKEKGSCKPYEKEYIRKDGQRVPVLIGYALLEGSDSDFVCFALNLSAQKKTEAALKTYTSQLEQSNRDLEEFAFVASHDLQEPLRKIETFGDALFEMASDNLSDLHRDYLERMRQAASRMRRMVDDLLELSRVSTRTHPFERVSLQELIEDVIQNLEVRIQSTGGVIKVGKLPIVKGDPAQLTQLFQNLIGNAIKFHKPEKAPKVWIDSVSGPDRGIQIIIKDNGIGFQEEHAERIFQPFQRLVGRSQYEGNGIGLAICRKIVERHGGKIKAKSSKGKGATFIIVLPGENVIKHDLASDHLIEKEQGLVCEEIR